MTGESANLANAPRGMSREPFQVDSRPLVTRTSLARDVRAAGVTPGDVLLVHTALSSLGFVVGAARSVIEALIDAVGEDGTLMMPTYSGELSDPAEWKYPPVPEDWIDEIRRETPAYDPQLTPTRNMGAVPELFRHYPGVRRSPHPQSSFAAWGARAGWLVDTHPLDQRFGPDSPLGRLYEADGKVLLLGAPPQTCSLYYLSQHRLKEQTHIQKRAPVMVDGQARWVAYDDVIYPNGWFNAATADLEDAGVIHSFTIGAAGCYLMPARQVIDFVSDWRLRHGV